MIFNSTEEVEKVTIKQLLLQLIWNSADQSSTWLHRRFSSIHKNQSYFSISFREDPCNLKVQISENTILGVSADVQIIRVDKIIVHKDYCK